MIDRRTELVRFTTDALDHWQFANADAEGSRT
jgi:hypothetical protein